MNIPPQIKYIRKGKCTQCGECCKHLHLASSEDWPQGMTGTVCNQLNKNGTCRLHPDKPPECSEFPNSPGDLIYRKVKDQCGYWFEEIRK